MGDVRQKLAELHKIKVEVLWEKVDFGQTDLKIYKFPFNSLRIPIVFQIPIAYGTPLIDGWGVVLINEMHI